MGTFNISLAIILYLLGILAFLFNGRANLIMIVISLELILLSVAIGAVNLSVGLDDLMGSYMTLILLTLAGAESAIALACLIKYYPVRGTIKLK